MDPRRVIGDDEYDEKVLRLDVPRNRSIVKMLIWSDGVPKNEFYTEKKVKHQNVNNKFSCRRISLNGLSSNK
jgi:hypothetical protein